MGDYCRKRMKSNKGQKKVLDYNNNGPCVKPKLDAYNLSGDEQSITFNRRLHNDWPLYRDTFFMFQEQVQSM